MKRKSIFGSILAVAILTLVSFSNVVGYQSVKSDSKLKSPLFNVRTNKATDEEEHNIQCAYIGKGKDVFIFQNNHRMTGLIEDIISDINNMDEENFLSIIQQVKNQFPNKSIIDGYEKDKLIDLFTSLQDKPDVLNKLQKYLSNIYPNDKSLETIGFEEDCLLYKILNKIFKITLVVIIVILEILLFNFTYVGPCWNTYNTCLSQNV